MLFKKLAKKSRSYRRFDGKHKISERTLLGLVELARFAPSMRNQQALKFLTSYEPAQNDLIFPALSWAGALRDWKGPKPEERPTAYIVILGDTRISTDYGPDYGIAAQNIILGATEKGLGGCMIGSISRELLRRNLNVPAHFKILLVVALGKPKEQIVLEDVKVDGNITYYRDKKSYHHVPKRKLKDLIIG